MMLTKLHALLVIFFAVITGAYMRAVPPEPLGETLNDSQKQALSQEQADYKTSNGKYKYYPLDAYAKDVQIHEYVAPDGSVGYQVYEYKTEKGERHIQSYGEGPEAAERSFTWKELNPHTGTASSTP